VEGDAPFRESLPEEQQEVQVHSDEDRQAEHTAGLVQDEVEGALCPSFLFRLRKKEGEGEGEEGKRGRGEEGKRGRGEDSEFQSSFT